METLYGVRIRVSPLARRPVLQLSPDFKWCSPEFRAKQNEWLLQMFGERDTVIPLPDGSIVISPEMHMALRREVEKGRPQVFRPGLLL